MNRYISYAKVLHMIAVDKGNFKTILFREYKDDSKLKEAYGILIKGVKHYEKIAEVCEQIKKKTKSNCIGNTELFCILVIEQFFSQKQKIDGGGKLKKIILEHKDFIAKQLETDISKAAESNLIKQDVHVRFIDKGFGVSLQKDNGFFKRGEADTHIRNLVKLSYSDYKEAIKEQPQLMESDEFVIQSKSSSMPAFLLFNSVIDKLEKGRKFDMIDCCSAPGNKTMQVAEYLGKRGKVHAFEKNRERFAVLQDRVNKFGFGKAIDCHNEDFLLVDTNEYKSVEYLVADPSCSGTGMLNHIYFDENHAKMIGQKKEVVGFEERTKKAFDSADKKMQARIESLAQFQLKILKKVAEFPALKAFSYSTCSIHRQENEEVVKAFLNEHAEFELVHAMPDWKERGFVTIGLPHANRLIRVNPFEQLSDGFFVAVFQKKTK